MVSQVVQQKTAGETEVEKFITEKSWTKYVAYLVGPHGEVKAGYRQRVGQDVGTVRYVRVRGWSPLGFQS